MHGFYISIDCDNCEQDIVYGPCATTIEHNGLPVIPYDIAAQATFHCDSCGASNYTGAFEDAFCEGGSEPDDEDDEDGDE